jgi:predicted transposase YbfD/YdcC
MSKSLVDYLKEVPDPRGNQGSRDDLWQILVIIIMGIMSGQKTYRGLERFVERHRRSLIKLLALKQGTAPSYSTLRRIMLNIDYTKLNSAFNSWAQAQTIAKGAAIAGDGKSLRNTLNNADNHQQNFITMVSLFSQEQGVVVATAIMENKKESEICVIQKLLSQLKLENHVFTMDALHCQKKTVETIVESNNDYIIKVKKNQPKLQAAIRIQTEQETPVQVKVEDEQSKGRKVQRLVEVFTPPTNIDSGWKNVQSVIRVTRSGERDGKAYSTLSYYLSSLAPTSERIAKVIQGHWQIENRLHWVKDVIFDEDNSPQRAGNAPINLSIIKTWVLSVFRIHGFESIKAAIDQISHNIPAMSALLF